MNTVSGVGGGGGYQTPPVNTAGVGGAQPSAQTASAQTASTSGANSAASTTSSLSSNSTSLQSRVSTFMSSVGSTMNDQQLLRALVMMLLLEAMDKQDQGSSKTSGLLLAGLSGGFGQTGSSSFTSISSSTSMHQFSQQSVPLDTSQAMQSISNGGGQAGQGQGPSGQLDVTG